MVIATTDLHFTVGFLKQCPAEFSGLDDQGFIEHPARPGVDDERCKALIGASGVGAVIANESVAIAMRIPFATSSAIQDLHEPHAIFTRRRAVRPRVKRRINVCRSASD